MRYMRLTPSMIALIIATIGQSALLLMTSAAAAACTCGPDYCQDDSRVPKALAAKKKSLKAAGYPDRLISLLDIDDQCVARITRSPDVFTMWLVDAAANKKSHPWSQGDEDLARRHVKDGTLTKFWIYNAKQAFSCCQQAKYDQRPDYNAEDEVSADTAILCKPSGGDVSCTK